MLRPWLLAILGLLAFALLVWFAGPLLTIGGEAPLASPQARVLVAAAFALQYLLQKLWSSWRARRSNERVVSRLTPGRAPGPAPGQAPRPMGEAVQLQERFAGALQTLRHARFGGRGGLWSSLSWKFTRQYLYQLPWYMIIGAPGAGKTTALLHSGLHFPLAGTLGRGSVKGVGGTRNCDWWFTDRAVLIDTAGRYTTHESDRIADRAAWEQFLALLREARPRRPLNGVLVAVSVTDLLSLDSAQLAEHADTLRARLDELQSELGRRLPVYLLLTKCDLLVGFVDWFSVLDRSERDQVWGATFDFAVSDAGTATGEFAPSFDRLIDRLARGLVDRLQSERDPQRRARIVALPRQLRGLREPLDALVRRAFGPGAEPLRAPCPCLRGVYLTSGTQEGTPIDRMLAALGRELGLQQRILAPNQNSGRSFFVSRLLTEVVFAEAELAGRTPSRQRWQRRLMLASLVAVQSAAVVLAAWWITGYSRSVEDIDHIGSEVARIRPLVEAMPVRADLDPRPLLPALNALRELALERAAVPRAAALPDVGQGARKKLAAATQQAYERMLLGPLLGQIARHIDALLRGGADVNLQYEALKAYAMFNDPAHFDAEALRAFATYVWDANLDPPLAAAERAELLAHLDALLKAGAVGSGASVEPAVVASVRARLSGQRPAQRLATRLMATLGSASYADFTVASLGPQSAQVFVGADGRSAPGAVPGRYTIEAYRSAVRDALPGIAAQLASEAPWVLGGLAGGDAAAAALASAQAASEALSSYRAEYARAWSDFLDGLQVRRAASRDEALRQAQVLGAPDGPLATLLRSVVRQTALDAPVQATQGTQGALAVVERLEALRRFVSAGPDGHSPLEAALKDFDEWRALQGAASGEGPREPAGLTSRLERIRADARRDPEPLRSALLALAALPAPAAVAGDVARGGSVARSQVSRQIGAKVGALCQQLLPGRYPFDRSAAREISLADFARLFAPAAAFDEVFGQLLAPLLDTSVEPWVLRDRGAGVDAAEVARFHAAARIRDVFFAHGRTQPALRLTLRPLDMDATIDRFELQIDGQAVAYAHGPVVASVVAWPGPRSGARIVVTPPTEGAPTPEFSGPWALFRLFDRVAIQPTASPGRFHAVFNVGGRHASFEIESDGGGNPFRLPELERFDCPPGP